MNKVALVTLKQFAMEEVSIRANKDNPAPILDAFNKLSAKKRKAIIIIIIGGTPYQPVSRLPAYILPAIRLAQELGNGTTNLILSSSDAGGFKYNYKDHPERALIRQRTQQKLDFLTQYVNTFFPHLFKNNVLAYRTESGLQQQIPDKNWRTLWERVAAEFPEPTEAYLNSAEKFTEKGQNPLNADIYGVRHAIWARDLVFPDEEVIQPDRVTPMIPQISFGGEKEEAFNWVREAVLQLPEEEISDILGTVVKKRQRIIRAITPFGTPVPYGRATYSSGSGRNKKIKVSDVELGDTERRGPFDIRGGNSLELIREEMRWMMSTTAQLADRNYEDTVAQFSLIWNDLNQNINNATA